MKYGIFKCANCGNAYEKMSSRHNACCQKCANAIWYKAHKMEPPEERTGICLNCGELFVRKRSGLGQKYCSIPCRKAYVVNKQAVQGGICAGCGKTFEWKKSGVDQKYCSKECRTKHHRKKYAAQKLYKSKKEKIDVKCAGCQKTYQAFINYIGTGTPRFFCPDCKKRNSYIVVYSPYDRSAETTAML